MDNSIINNCKNELITKLRKIDFEQLPISDYNKSYIRRITDHIEHYMNIYALCLNKGIRAALRSPEEIILVDYGGGSGFLSYLAKAMGISTVIYVDLNPLSVATTKTIQQEIGLGPDILIEGDSDRLAAWCREQGIQPHLLIATDLIEHIYDLKHFFSDLLTINGRMNLLFTTASTPYNPMKTHQLHRLMRGCETGDAVQPNYATLRRQFIQHQFPHLSEKQISEWTARTRGLIYRDIQRAIESNTPPTLYDPFNTCHPETGNWAERILSIRDYKQIIAPYGYTLKVDKGFYNTIRPRKLVALICRFINLCIKGSGRLGLLIAPFIILSVYPRNTNRQR